MKVARLVGGCRLAGGCRLVATRWVAAGLAAAELVAAGLLGGFGGCSVARADVRVWESTRSDEEDPTQHRYLDLWALAQPGWVVRLADDEVGAGEGGPWLQRARLGLRGQIAWWALLHTELEFLPTPAPTDIYLDLKPHAAAQVRVGQFRVPFLATARFHERDIGFLDRPLYVPLRNERPYLAPFSPEGSSRGVELRDMGVMVHGQIGDPTPGLRLPVLEYALAAFLGGGANQDNNADDALGYAARLRLHILGVPSSDRYEGEWARGDRVHVAVGGGVFANCGQSGFYERGTTFDAEVRAFGVYASGSLLWVRNSFADGHGLADALNYDEACSEQASIERTSGDGSAADPLASTDFVSRGAHFQVQYLLPHMLFPVPRQWLEVLTRFDWVDPNSPFDSGAPVLGGDSTTPGYMRPTAFLSAQNAPTVWRLTFGLNWFPTAEPNLRLGINYQFARQTESILIEGERLSKLRNDRLWLQLTGSL